MNEWMETFIAQCLADVPPGKYHTRTEKELRDHMESLRQSMTEAEVLRHMGDPERLREEYEAAWERSLPGRLEELGHCLKTWAKGFVVMFGAHALAFQPIGRVWDMAIALPGNSHDPKIQMIRNTLGDLNNSMFWWEFFPLVCALMVGAYYLARKFRTSRHPAWQIGVGLSFHWAFIFAFDVWWEAADDHRTFLEELWGYLTYHYTFWYYSLTLAICVLLGVVFGQLLGRKKKGSLV